MAINNLTSLELALADWVARTDLTNAVLDNFIDIAESEILHGIYDETGRLVVPPLRVKQMETRNAAFSLDGEYTALPTGFLGFRTLKTIANPNLTLTYVTPSVFDATYLSTNTDSEAQVYTISAGQLRTGPGSTAGELLEIIYWAAPDNLVTSGTNWLCTAYPHAYLYGALRHLAIYIGMDSRLPYFQSAFVTTLAAIHGKENGIIFSGTSLESRPLGVTVR